MAKKKNDTAVDTIKKSEVEFTNESALALIRKQEAKIQKVAKARIPQPNTNKKLASSIGVKIRNRVMLPFMGIMASGIPIASIDTPTAGIIATAMVLGGGVATMTSMGFIMNESTKLYSLLFPKSFKKEMMNVQSDTLLWELKEKEYKKAESKALANAKPALDYLNSKMVTEALVFTSELGKESFIVVEKEMNTYEKVLAKVDPKDNLTKELESLKQSPILAIEIKEKEPANV